MEATFFSGGKPTGRHNVLDSPLTHVTYQAACLLFPRMPARTWKQMWLLGKLCAPVIVEGACLKRVNMPGTGRSASALC